MMLTKLSLSIRPYPSSSPSFSLLIKRSNLSPPSPNILAANDLLMSSPCFRRAANPARRASLLASKDESEEKPPS